MITKEYMQKELARRIAGIRPNVPTNTDVLIGELKSVLVMVDCLPGEISEKPINPEEAMKELDEKIALVKQSGTWDGVDVDKYMDEVRGREPEKPTPADLEEAAEEYTYGGIPDEMKSYVKPVGDEIIKNFIAGANWQKQHDAELIEIAYNDGITIGMTKQKEQMMKEAVEGEVYLYHSYNRDATAILVDIPKEHLGDKVRVIICKKED